MIRMIQSKSSAQAKAYFNESLQKADYYLNRQELIGFAFQGKIGDRIGISSSATKEMFHALVENKHPTTGAKLTSRTVQNRTIGYDINFHCPKSVSVLHVLSKDNHILQAFQQSVHDTMLDIEQDSLVRVRKNDQDDNRQSGELLWAEFVHQTARPVKEQSPDPHLHCHCYTFNVAWDDIEQQFKAGQFRLIKRDMPYYQARFHKRIADRLMSLGYRIRKTKTGFEVAGIPQEAIDLFSKRTKEVEQYAAEHNITEAKELDKIGSLTRAKKQQGLSMADLLKDWRKQIRELGLDANKSNGNIIRYDTQQSGNAITTAQAIDHALSHHFERASVCPDRKLLQKAYSFAIGAALPISCIDTSFQKNADILKIPEVDQVHCTTVEMVQAEKRMIALARSGKAAFEPLYKDLPPLALSDEQSKAAVIVLTTADQVCLINGRAGTGKTTMMQETVRLIKDRKISVTIVAPTAQAARHVLVEEGFTEAQTVAKLLTDTKLQQQLSNSVLWVDEAGLLGVQDMTKLLNLAVIHKTKVILSGDTSQHGSVAYGDALRLINTLAGLDNSEIHTIYRQKNELYKAAVKAISSGDVKEGFEKLDGMGAIVHVHQNHPVQPFLQDYTKAVETGKSVLVISPTHREGEFVTAAIRASLKESGRIGKKDRVMPQLVNLNLTAAEKKETVNFMPGMVLQFNQNDHQIKRGSAWVVVKVEEHHLHLENKQKETLDFHPAQKDNFDVFEQRSLPITKHDRILVTRNGMDANKQRLNNGQELTVVGLDRNGRLKAINPHSKKRFVLDKDFGHLNHAYCMTSHASQGKTVDEVFIFQPAATFGATDLRQFYVSVSRGRYAATVYTDDKVLLLAHIARSGNRRSAIELLQWQETKAMTELAATENPPDATFKKTALHPKKNNKRPVKQSNDPQPVCP